MPHRERRVPCRRREFPILSKPTGSTAQTSPARTAIAKSLIKLNLSAASARAVAANTGVDLATLGAIATSITACTHSTPPRPTSLGRFDLSATALLDKAYQRDPRPCHVRRHRPLFLTRTYRGHSGLAHFLAREPSRHSSGTRGQGPLDRSRNRRQHPATGKTRKVLLCAIPSFFAERGSNVCKSSASHKVCLLPCALTSQTALNRASRARNYPCFRAYSHRHAIANMALPVLIPG